MRALGLDFGEKTIGVAVSDPEQKVALGLETIRRNDPDAISPSINRLAEIIGYYGVGSVILGYPMYMDGGESPGCKRVLAFKKIFEKTFNNINVELWDERLSTVAVTRIFEDDHAGWKRVFTKVDEMAAVFILQGYLDKQNNEREKRDFLSDGYNIDSVVTMSDEDGKETDFAVLASKKDGGVLYLLTEDLEEDGMVYHFKCTDTDNDDMILELIDSKHDEFGKMLELFKEDYATLAIETE